VDDIVFFGAVKAPVVSATTTSLTVTAPAGTTYQPITVTTNGLTGYANKPFILTFQNCGLGLASNSFADKEDFPAGNRPSLIAGGDFDGDGRTDIVALKRSDNRISVLRNTGTSSNLSFATNINYITGSVPYNVAIGDLNGDGKLDLVVSNAQSNTVSVFRNTSTIGNISFSNKTDFQAGPTPRDVIIADLDGDGKSDLAVTNDSGNVSVLRSTSSLGNIGFAGKIDFQATGDKMAVGDLNGDGKPDLVCGASILKNASSPGTISFAPKVDFFTRGASSIAISDLEGDGKPDIAITVYAGPNPYVNGLFIFKNTGNNNDISMAAAYQINTIDYPLTVSAGDLDGDAKPDLAVWNVADNVVPIYYVTVHRNKSEGGTFRFDSQVKLASAGDPIGSIIADIDGDGKTDLMTANNANGLISFFRNQSQLACAAPSFEPAIVTSFTPSSGPIGTTVVISGSNFSPNPSNNIVLFGGTKALVISASSTSLTVIVPAGATDQPLSVTTNQLTGYANKAFIVTFPNSCPYFSATSFAEKVDYTAGSEPRSVVTGDLDGDGKPDVAVANSNSKSISLFRNTSQNGAVSFAQKTDLATEGTAFSVAIGDINGDGKPDLVATNSNTGTVSIFENKSTPGVLAFANRVDIYAGYTPRAVAIADLDGDGRADLVVTNTYNTFLANYPAYVSVLRNVGNRGTVAFAYVSDYVVGNEPYSIAVGDLNGDGKPDLAVANVNSSSVSVFRNTSTSGTIMFAQRIDYASGKGPWSVALGDLDADGKADMVVANNFSGGTVSILKNTAISGTIAFAQPQELFGINNPTGVALGDFDGDGKLDLSITSSATGVVSIFKNVSQSGTIAFSAKVSYETGTDPSSLSIADFNGDGKPDLVAANKSAGTISVLKNQSDIPCTLSVFPAPAINSFSPASGPVGTTVTINGSNFSPNPADNIVYFGVVRADVLSAATTSLTVAVPAGATYKPLSVTTHNLTAYSTKPFIQTFPNNCIGLLSNSFGGKVHLPNSSGSNYITMADLDGDGRLDLATLAGFNSNSVSIFRNTGTSDSLTFEQSGNYLTGDTPVDIAIADVDGDARLDLLVTHGSSRSKTFAVLLNTGSVGNISFAAAISFTVPTPTGFVQGLTIGDFNEDGKPDVAIVATDMLFVYQNSSSKGSIAFSQQAAISVGGFRIAAGDLNGDGKTDLVVNNYNSSSISIFSNISANGAIAFAPKIDYITGANPNSIVISDFDGDNKPDIAVAISSSPGVVSVFKNSGVNGAVSFSAKQDYIIGSSVTHIIAGDLDGDGKPDLVVTSQFEVSLLRNTSDKGTIRFAGKVELATGSAENVAIGDLNGDGRPDLAIANGSFVLTNQISCASNPVASPSITSIAPAVGQAGSTVTINGNNFDPIPGNNIIYFGAVKAGVLSASTTKLVVTVPTGTTFKELTVTTNNLTAYSRQPFIVAFPNSGQGFLPNSFAGKVDFGVGVSPKNVALSDLDGDGKADMVVTNSSSSSASLLRNTGNPGMLSFASKVDLVTGSVPVSVVTGDLDGDGKPEAVVANESSNTISIYRNKSTAGAFDFAPRADILTGKIPSGLAIGDFDEDGKPDLVIINKFSNTLFILKNIGTLGNISFAKTEEYSTTSSPSGVAISDIDGDGKVDIVVTNEGAGTVSVFKNITVNGSIVFSNKSDFVVGSGANRVAIADLDGDGKPDLVVSNILSKSISILRNTSIPGTFEFSEKIDYVIGVPSGVAISDLDGDEKVDIAVTIGQDTLTILRNTSMPGAILFTNQVSYMTGNNPQAVALGDMDNDGKPDMIVTNYNSNTVSVLRNLISANPICTPTFLNKGSIVLDASCSGNDGNISLIPTSGTAPFQYSINGGTTYVSGPDTGYTFLGLVPGMYQLRLKGADGCESDVVQKEVKAVYGCPVTCVAPAFLNSNAIVLDASCGKSDGSITIIPISGTAPFMYSANGGTTYVTGPNRGFTFSSLAGGTYRLRLKDATGCESVVIEKTVRNIYNCPGITTLFDKASSLISKEALTVSPNPTKGLFKVQLPNIISGKAELSVFDAKGIAIQKKQAVLSKSNTIDFDLTGRAPGLYYIQMVTGNGTRMVKVVVQ